MSLSIEKTIQDAVIKLLKATTGFKSSSNPTVAAIPVRGYADSSEDFTLKQVIVRVSDLKNLNFDPQGGGINWQVTLALMVAVFTTDDKNGAILAGLYAGALGFLDDLSPATLTAETSGLEIQFKKDQTASEGFHEGYRIKQCQCTLLIEEK